MPLLSEVAYLAIRIGLFGVEFRSVGSDGGDRPVGIGLGAFAVLIFRGLGQFGGRGFFLQHGVGLEFRLQKILEFQGGGLEELEGLLDLGRDGGGLTQAGLEGNRHGMDFGIGVGLKKGKRHHG